MMLSKARKALRITNTAFDEEIQDLIDTAKIDLHQAGVSQVKLDTPDAIIERAIKTYVKAHFGYDNPDADRLNDAYVMLKQHLSLYGDYKDDTNA